MSNISRRFFYYENLFPFEDTTRWLSYKNGYLIPLREISLGLAENRFIRNVSFTTAADFKLNVCRFNPERIDIGPLYNISPTLAMLHLTKSIFKYIVSQKEMTFDIDISDYEVRTCCKGKDICCKCWKYMSLACKILDKALKEDFGFEHILWTYSGGRGVHCWVCDESARKLGSSVREAIADYLQVVKGGAFNIKKVHFEKDPHPSIKRALRIIEPDFVKICIEEQNILGTEEGIEMFFRIISSICHSQKVKEDLIGFFKERETSMERWKIFLNYFEKINDWRTCFVVEELIIQCIYPRLDVAVTTVMTHLLKAPFSPHSQTQKICIPFEVEKADYVDPTSTPDLPSLFRESQLQKNGTTGDLKVLKQFQEACLLFKRFVDKLERYNGYT